jgi:endonuclease/exonuclease/phosphatase family metal-dependent hydrolase
VKSNIFRMVGVLGLALCAARAVAQDPANLRIMSYNIHHATGNDSCSSPAATIPPAAECGLNLNRIADIIRTHSPDIVGLQEVDQFWGRSGNIDQAAFLAQALGMSLCAGMNLDHAPDAHSNVRHRYGTAILSRFPIRDCNNTPLPKAADESERRGLLTAGIDVRGTTLLFYNTHLHTRAADRVIQLKKLAALLGLQSGPMVLVGDLNARPSEASLAPLRVLLRDAWDLAGTGSGFTLPAAIDRQPDRRIDYVWVSSGIEVVRTSVDIRPATTMASDHYPVAADVRLNTK